MKPDPRGVALRARIEKWFWIANYVVVAFLYVGGYRMEDEGLKGLSIGYLMFLSVHALVLGASGKEQAAESRFPEDEDG